MKQSVPQLAPQVDDEIQMERNAGLIMATNNSSIVSKRSVERLYLPEPHFYRYFVRKPQRRSPTINRGYWLRMRAVDWAVRRFLERPSDQPKIVINLGCGYDPLPFHWLATEKDLCNNVKFIDIDYEELMITKRTVIRSTPRMKDLLSDDIQGRPDKSILLDSPEYAAVGCDLRNVPRLQRLLQSICNTQDFSILCVAEVSITYMHTDAADAVIEWTSKLSSDVTFCLCEQGSPDRPDHPFTETMVKHFKKLGSPLHSLFEYPGPHMQSQRFHRAGFTHCETQNLWELWSNPEFLSPSQRLALDHIEPFDEWEDFALFASHYLLVIAHNRIGNHVPERPRSRRDSCASIGSDLSVRTASPFKPGEVWFAMKYYSDSTDDTQRHHASAYQVPDQDAIAIHGGVGPRARRACTAVCRSRSQTGEPPVIIPSEVGARCCHTITTLNNGQNLLVGGRGSPTQPMKDCWIQTGSQWTRVEDLPEPRYRHRTVPVILPDGFFGAVVFGGKTDASRVAATTLMWDPRTGWRTLESLDQTPVPRFGASFVYLGFNHGLLFGGMRQDGIICQGFWRWRLVIRDNRVAGIRFRTSDALDASVGAYPWFARLGASCGIVRDELLIIGGIARSGTIPKVYEMLSILGSFSTFSDNEKEMQLRLTCVEPEMPPDLPRPFFIGHSTHRTKTGTLVFIGGGATCFSFGNYYNSGVWIMHLREEGLNADWTLVKTQPPQLGNAQPQARESICLSPHSYIDVRPADILTPEDFLWYIRADQPAVARRLHLGPCLRLWTPAYLRSKVANDRSVVIHSSPLRSMNFQRKDFAYRTLAFPDFISALVSKTSHIYLRALSSTDPTKSPADFEKDWPELSSDFSIPPSILTVLAETRHSSCLRISNDVSMWLHYDVMSNMLFQVHGIKKLILFPPTDIKRLSFPPGSTTSEIDVFNFQKPLSTNVLNGEKERSTKITKELGDVTISIPEGTSPRVVVLRPGDALLIPPLWAHTGISLEHDTLATKLEESSTSVVTPSPQKLTPTDSLFTDESDLHTEADLHTRSESQTQTQTDTNRHTNIALNVFFRSMPPRAYANGRDVYGNRDLAPYEDGRRDLDRIINRFLTMSNNTSTNGTSASAPATTMNGTNSKRQQQQKSKRKDTESLSPQKLPVSQETTLKEEEEPGHQHAQEAEPAPSQIHNNSFGRESILDTIPKDITKAYLERLADELKRRAAEL